jgi:hypothetical protein
MAMGFILSDMRTTYNMSGGGKIRKYSVRALYSVKKNKVVRQAGLVG